MGGLSDSLSEKEIDSVKRLVLEREKEARKDNIIIRGYMDGRSEIIRERVEEFIKEKEWRQKYCGAEEVGKL